MFLFRNMLCGPNTIEWSVETLKRTLRPKGDFTIRASEVIGQRLPEERDKVSQGEMVDTMDWLREALVELDQPQRLKFMELTTGLGLLTSDEVSQLYPFSTMYSLIVMIFITTSSQVITVRMTSERWPFFHSCTNQLDFPVYHNPTELRKALHEALANGSAGGFSELTHSVSESGS